jgi:hypothetical protein
MPEFEYNSSKELQDLITALPVLALQAADPAMTETLIFLHGKIPENPELPMLPGGHLAAPDGVSFLHTDQQRAWFFGSIKKGQLPGWAWEDGHPAKTGSARTGTLGRRFTEKVEKTDQAVIGQIGTNLEYAPWVVGPSYPGEEINGRMMYQAQIHVDRWWQFGDVMADNIEAAWKIFTEEFWPEFTRRIEEQSHAVSNP